MSRSLATILSSYNWRRFVADEDNLPSELFGAGVCVICLESNDFQIVEPTEVVTANDVVGMAVALLKSRKPPPGKTWIAMLLSVPKHAERLSVCEELTLLCSERTQPSDVSPK
jgi:hypothetical protein